MESLKNIKDRIHAVRNVGQITKAMEVVAATKMRKAQGVLLATRPYAWKALELLTRLTQESLISPLTSKRSGGVSLLVVIASDKGLTGAFNAQVFRSAETELENRIQSGETRENLAIYAIGKKTIEWAKKINIGIVASHENISDTMESHEVHGIAEDIVSGFLRSAWNRVTVISTHFRTALKQEVFTRELLPVNRNALLSTIKEIVPEHGRYADRREELKDIREIEYIFEPSQELILDVLYRHLVNTELYHLILEANASEHSARRVAMKTASDNAGDLSHDLELSFNKARQSAITNELIEITSTQSAMAS